MLNQVPAVLSYIQRGDLPANWELRPVGEIILESKYGLNHPQNPDGNAEIVGMKDIGDGKVRIEQLVRTQVSDSEWEEYRLKSEDLLLNRTNRLDQVGKIGIVEDDCDAVFASYLVRLVCDRSKVDPRYLNSWLNSSLAQRAIKRIATPAIGQANLNPTEFQKYCLVPLPPLWEQHRIAEILRSWDEAIETTERLIAAKERLFDGFASSLINGRRRFISDTSNWPLVGFADATRELTDRNSGKHGEDRVMGVNKLHGMVPMQDHVRSKDLSRYKLVPPNAFAYNPMRLNIGSLAINDCGHEVVVSPDYVVFEARKGQLDPRFFDHLRRTSIWRKFVTYAGTGSVRVRIYYEHLAALAFPLPPIEVQQRIAATVDTAAYEIKLLKSEKAALECQRRGLMQKLLTGEWRVPVRDGEVADLAEQAATEAAL